MDTESDAKAAIGFFEAHRRGPGHLPAPQRHLPRSLQESGWTAAGALWGGLPPGPLRGPVPGIVENLLGRTVIVEELDSAIAMARQYRSRFKIVTLDGQVMNPGGSMTGGSVAKEAGFLSRANELKRLTAQEATLQAQKEETEAALAEAQRAVGRRSSS